MIRTDRTHPFRLAFACALMLSAWPATSAPMAATSPMAMAGTAPVMLPLTGQDAAGGMWPVRLDVARLRAAKARDMLRFALPGGHTLEVVFDSTVGRADGVQWIGHLAAGRQYPVRLKLDGTLASGVIRTPHGGYVLGHIDGTQLIGDDLSGAASATALDTLPSMFTLADTTRDTGNTPSPALARPADVAHPVALDLVALSALVPGAEVALSIPEHGDYRVTYDRTDAGDIDTTTWVGHLKDYGSEFRVIITSGPNGSVGNILTPSGEILLVDNGDQQWLVDPVRSGLRHVEPDHSDAIGEEMAAGGAARGSTTTTATTAGSSAGASADATLVDVLVLYTAGFKKRHGSVWATRLSQLVALGNQAYTDSGVPLKLRLVGTEQVSQSDTTSNSTTLSALAKGTGAFGKVPSLRKKYGADLVTLVRPFYMSAQGGNCGVGYIGGYNGSNIAQYAGYAYSVVSDGKDMAGTGYYCTDYTFTHELGHNMGLMHDRATVASQGGGTGSHDYAFGYGRSGSFGTVMSYVSPVIGRFSTPELSTCGGSFACGVPAGDPESAHNALALTNNRAAISAFTTTMIATTFQVSGTVSRSGKALAGVKMNASHGASCTPSGKTGAYACTVPWGWSGVIAPVLAAGSASPGTLSLSSVTTAQTKKNFTVR